MRSPLSLIRETFSGWGFDVSRTSWWADAPRRLRGFFASGFRSSRPRSYDTSINYETARALYRNEEPGLQLGGVFVKPIVDLIVEFMGTPVVSSASGDDEQLLNECIRDYWADSLKQTIRDCLRDSDVVVRFWQPRIDNKLFTQSDRDHGSIEVIPPEFVTLIYNPVDPNLLDQAIIEHIVKIDERTADQVQRGEPPTMHEHRVIETITPSSYTFYDATSGQPLTGWSTNNVLGFVPLYKAYNEYAADLGGGQSEIEQVLPLIEAFHDVMDQTLTAHRDHSIPTTKFKLKDVDAFVANNFPEAIDPETGKVSSSAKINWNGNQVFLFGPEEDGDYIQATSVLGDSKTLLSFLLDCICVASKTPRWAFLADDVASGSSASVDPFKKKIEHKRVVFKQLYVMICKMVLAANNRTPETVRLSWPPVLLEDFTTRAQAIQQIVLALDVATIHQWLSDETAVKTLAELFPLMNEPAVEMRLALANKVVDAAPAPASITQALPPAPPAPAMSTNGKVASSAARVAIATTSASRS